MTTYYEDCNLIAKSIIGHVGKKIVMCVPLGIGKPIGLINSLYTLACADKSINLTFLTALTLARPGYKNELEKRFLEPILDRLLEDYVDPLYEKDRVLNQLPENVKVIEFYLSPGKYLHNKGVQQSYINSNYTDVIRDISTYTINVVAQQVSRSTTNSSSYSLSSNSDLFHEAVDVLIARQQQGNDIAVIAEVNLNLPFMYGGAVVDSSVFTHILDTGRYHSLFAMPHPEISVQDHMIGLYTSALIPDGACMQIGIGKLGDAITNALIMRHKDNENYQRVLKQFSVMEKFGDDISSLGSTSPFNAGLYASTEMLCEGYLRLYRENILKKKVYDHTGLQRLLNAGVISEKITPDIIDILLNEKIIHPQLTLEDMIFLQTFGIFKQGINLENGLLMLPGGEKISADLTSRDSRNTIATKCLGESLLTGKIVHAGFFIGSREFYQQLLDMPSDELRQIDMTTVERTNTLFWSYELATLQRQHARFINTCMMVSLEGAITSDGLKNWQEVSGVGGQFDFAVMAHQLENARFIINCHSTNKLEGKIKSNILWQYPNVTIPRHLRDIVITEYGIADCRSKTDSDVIKSLLNVTDSRFQADLLKKAKESGKLSEDYSIPKEFQANYPERIKKMLHEFQQQGYFKAYPFDCSLMDDELVLASALMYLKNCSKFKLLLLLFCAFFYIDRDGKFNKYLHRMKFDTSKKFKDIVYRKILLFALYLTRAQ